MHLAVAGLALSSLVFIAPALAESLGSTPIFGDGFEFGDTGDWSAAEPPRCDAIRPFDRAVAPTSFLHVAPPPAGNDSTGDGSPGRAVRLDRARRRTRRLPEPRSGSRPGRTWPISSWATSGRGRARPQSGSAGSPVACRNR
jgi:hypothetical protein